MKKFEGIIRDASLNNLQKALYCRRETISKLAKEGYSDYAIARYFRISPKVVRRTLKKFDDIPQNRISNKNEIQKLIEKREEVLKGREKTILRHGFLKGDYILPIDSLLQELYACYWTYEDVCKYFKEVEGEEITENILRFNRMKERAAWSQNEIFVMDLLERGYNARDIIEYLAVPEHAFDVVKEEFYKGFISCVEGKKISKAEKKAAKQEWIRLKSEERVGKVYNLRVVKKLTERETASLLNICRATVHNDLKRYFIEHPELKDEYCEKGKRRRYYK